MCTGLDQNIKQEQQMQLHLDSTFVSYVLRQCSCAAFALLRCGTASGHLPLNHVVENAYFV